MPQPHTMNPNDLHGLQVIDTTGDTIGKVATVYLDVEHNTPEWAAVSTGLFGTHVSLVPLVNATITGRELRVPYTKNRINSAPHHDPDRELSTAQEAELFTHYDVPYGGATVTATGTTGGPVGQPNTPPADQRGSEAGRAMIRSEEHLHVGTETVRTGTARLRKHVVTETVIQNVALSHEELRVRRVALTDTEHAQSMAGTKLSEEEHELVLHAERPVIGKDTVPVERVTLATELVTDHQEVSAQVRTEQIEQVIDPAPGRLTPP